MSEVIGFRGLARGRVFKDRATRTWVYEVYDLKRGTVRFTDNTGPRGWQTIYDACVYDVAVLDRVLGAGHKLKRSYAELVSRVAD